MSKIPWVEKYRPTKLNNIHGNEDIIDIFHGMVKSKELVNTIINGPAGVGKTSTIISLAKEYYGINYADYILELNASDDRVVDVVRGKIAMFSKKKIKLPIGCKYKMIILDEMDNMIPDAQEALRVIMETYELTTKFMIMCNNIQKIIEPIQSRCLIFQYNKISDKNILQMITKIALKENVPYDTDGLKLIVDTCDGDLRDALNNLQSTSYGFNKITKKTVSKVCSIPHPVHIKDILDTIIDKTFINVLDKIENLLDKGYSIQDIIELLIKIIISSPRLEQIIKGEVVRLLGKFSMNYMDGINSPTQYMSLISKIIKIIKNDE